MYRSRPLTVDVSVVQLQGRDDETFVRRSRRSIMRVEACLWATYHNRSQRRTIQRILPTRPIAFGVGQNRRVPSAVVSDVRLPVSDALPVTR